MAANQGWLDVQGAVDEILRRRGTTPDSQAGSGGTRYGRLYAPPPENLAALRRQQAEFGRVAEDLDRRNSWMAIPALAPLLPVPGAETAAILGARGAAAGAGAANPPLYLRGREPWPLDRTAKEALWKQARKVWARANNTEASKLDAQVHHRDLLEWAHLKPEADPNRLANLWALSPDEHIIATREWAKFARGLGREPTPAEAMEAMMRIDRLIGSLVRRPGASRPNPAPE